jgi:hypothetical protein
MLREEYFLFEELIEVNVFEPRVIFDFGRVVRAQPVLRHFIEKLLGSNKRKRVNGP